MGTELAVVQEHYDMTSSAMDAKNVTKQIQLIQSVMKEAMKEGEHYGVIPGCTKPSLYKPGAEKLSLTFRLSPTYEITEIPLPNAHREYRVTCTITHIPTNSVFGQGVGSCSTMEGKFRYRNEELKCPLCGAFAIIKGKKDFGGGFICWEKKGGCKAKFKEDEPTIINQPQGKIEHDNPADYYNTCLKMAKKRAHVDAILTVTAASDIFTQDLEDMGEVLPPPAEPKTESPKEIKDKGTMYLAELKRTFKEYAPGQSDKEKKAKIELIKKLFNTDKWEKVENSSWMVLKQGVERLKVIIKVPENVLDNVAKGQILEPPSDVDLFEQ